MKINVAATMFSILLFSITGSAVAQTNGTGWTQEAADKWFNKKEWLGGAHLQPHPSINKIVFATQYQLNKQYWDEAFGFLKGHNLDSLPKGRYTIDGDNVYAMVTQDSTKDFDKTKWESHRKFVDLQYVASGEEKLGVYPVKDAVVTNEYDDTKDLANYTAPGKFYVAGPGTFFLFFPSDAHRPNITPGGNKVEKKIVIKVKWAKEM